MRCAFPSDLVKVTVLKHYANQDSIRALGRPISASGGIVAIFLWSRSCAPKFRFHVGDEAQHCTDRCFSILSGDGGARVDDRVASLEMRYVSGPPLLLIGPQASGGFQYVPGPFVAKRSANELSRLRSL